MTIFTGTKVGKTFTPIGGGLLAVASGLIAISAAPVVADVYQLFSLPRGAIIVDGKMWATDIDANVTETLNFGLGWAANGVEALSAAGLIPASVISGDAVLDVVPASKSIRNFDMSAGELAFTNDTIVQATCNAVAATFAAGTLYAMATFYIK